MDQPQREDSGGLADAIDREQLGRLVASRHPPQPTSTLPRRSKTKWVFLTLALTVGLLALVSGLFQSFRTRSGVAPPQTAASNPQSSTRPPYQATIEHDMVLIQGGTFQMGRDDGPDNEKPAHSESVKPFYIDKTEVTNAQYAEFVKAVGYPAPTNDEGEKPYWKAWDHDKPPEGQEDWPVRNVSLKEAVAYATWLSHRDGVEYRLPTEQEWEYVARNGGSTKLYPWGNEWKDGYANIDSTSVSPVGSFKQGATSAGVLDMIGNVWEWTSSRASLYPGSLLKIPDVQVEGGWPVARGGSYQTSANRVSGTLRDWFPKILKHPTIGFRLARSDR